MTVPTSLHLLMCELFVALKTEHSALLSPVLGIAPPPQSDIAASYFACYAMILLKVVGMLPRGSRVDPVHCNLTNQAIGCGPSRPISVIGP